MPTLTCMPLGATDPPRSLLLSAQVEKGHCCSVFSVLMVLVPALS
ncbi:hypothetical protein SAMN05216284_10731 [Micromonospora sediminimaris]|nr:hypothetical protein SAMN05216284_10731 [Micromonospora sediminimaris]